jgi:fructokinase
MVIAFGEVLWDILPSGEQLGGAVANCTFRLHQLGTPTRLISRLGDDAHGKKALEILKSKGLSCDLIQTDLKHPTGTVDVTISPEGDADYVINPEVAYDYIEAREEDTTLASQAQAIVFGNLIQRNEVSRNTLYQLLEAAPDALKVIDINLRKDCYSKQTIQESLARTDVLKLNDKEVTIVTEFLGLKAKSFEAFCEEVAATYSVSSTLISLGSKGVYAFDTKEGHIEIAGYSCKVVDTIGAGDNFLAGFVHTRLQGKNLSDSCDFANLIGALVTTKVGGMPILEEYEINGMAAQIR